MGKPLPPSSFSSSSSFSSRRLLQPGTRRPLPPCRAPQQPGRASGMGAPPVAPSLLLLLAGAAGLCRAFFSLPLRVSQPAVPRGSPPAPVPLRPGSGGGRQRDAPAEPGGLALASEPGGSINFLAMVDNLQGDSGRGYYLEMLLGTPPQAVGVGRGEGGKDILEGERIFLGGRISAAGLCRPPPFLPKRNFLSPCRAGRDATSAAEPRGDPLLGQGPPLRTETPAPHCKAS